VSHEPAPATLAEQVDQLRAQHRLLLERIDSGEARFRSLARSVWRVQEEERRRIARELHDGIGQNLTALKHTLALIGSAAGDNPQLRGGVETALALCSRTLQETRELSRLLRPQILDDLGLAAALNWLARTLAADGGPQIDVEFDAREEIDGDLRTLVFRVVQEALTNVVRHAGAAHAIVRIIQRGDALDVLVWDDGAGCDSVDALGAASAGSSGGLSGMRERVELHGGQLQFESSPGGGCRVRCSLPLLDSRESQR